MTFVPTTSFNWQGSAEQGADVQTEYTGSLGCTRHPAVAFSENQRGEVVTHDVAHSIKTGGGKPGQGYPAVAHGRWVGGSQQDEIVSPDAIVNALAHSSATHSGHHEPKVISPDLAVRRLTPRECERLMGWPDDHTRWADDGTEIADSHRYRMCGNGVVAPVAAWIGRNIANAATQPTQEVAA